VNREGGDVATMLHRLHPNAGLITLNRPSPEPIVEFVAPPADNGQLERIRTSLATEIADGSVEVDERGDFIFVRVGNTLLFGSGSATVKPEFADLAAKIAVTIDAEQGPLRVLGFTDDIQPSGRGRYKTNLELSVARAEGVAAVLRPLITAADRITVEGRGEASPIADNSTREGRAENRRVEILMAKEGTF